jgi:hypothetical protein
MKRITQILASVLFIITVLTIYLAFDFAINNAVPKKYSNDNIFKKTSTFLSLLKTKNNNQTLNHNNDDNEHIYIDNQERRTRSTKQKQHLGKHAQFHKSKTGVKINQVKKSAKEQRKRLPTTKTHQRKDIKSKSYD